jgi:hypothetical protein
LKFYSKFTSSSRLVKLKKVCHKSTFCPRLRIWKVSLINNFKQRAIRWPIF